MIIVQMQSEKKVMNDMKEYIVPEPKHIALKDVDYKTFFGEPVEELTRCKDCAYFNDLKRKAFNVCTRTSALIAVEETDYCSQAKRKE